MHLIVRTYFQKMTIIESIKHWKIQHMDIKEIYLNGLFYCQGDEGYNIDSSVLER